jgi:SNF2 family DNA or RNA helicase
MENKMKSDFKQALHEIFMFDGYHYFSRKEEKKYRQLIRFGVFGETGENHYIFIYKDFFDRNLIYDGVLFYYDPLNFDQPVEIRATAQSRAPDRTKIFIRVALYFLEKHYKNTLELSDKIKPTYERLKKLIDDFIEAKNEKRKELESLDYNVQNQEILFEPMKPLPLNRQFKSPDISERLSLLKDSKKIAAKTETVKRPAARVGLCLLLNESGYEVNRFKPIILPIKKDGSYGTVKAGTSAQMERYDTGDVPDILKKYVLHQGDSSRRGYNDTARLDTLNRVYFGRLAEIFFEMPDDLTFYQSNPLMNPFLPLKKIKFKKLVVKFAPYAERELLGLYLVVTAVDGNIFQPGIEYRTIVFDEDEAYLYFNTNGQSYFAIPEEPGKFVRLFRFLAKSMHVSIYNFKAVRDALKEIQSTALSIQLEPMTMYSLTFRPQPILKIHEEKPSYERKKYIAIDFDYNYPLEKFFTENPHVELYYYKKDRPFEYKCIDLLRMDPMLSVDERTSFRRSFSENFYFTFTNGNEMKWLLERGKLYLEKGFKIYSESRGQYIGKGVSSLQLDIRQGIKWLEFKPLLRNDETGETVDIDWVDFRNYTISDKDGALHLVKKEDLEKLAKLSKYAEKFGNIFRVPSENYFLINELYDSRMDDIPQLKEKLLCARKLESFQEIPNCKLSRKFNGKLRKYQKDGFKWLHFLHEYGLSGCLADDMGLGKTVQTLALLLTLKDEGKLATSLLVVPVSAVPNWESEIRRFTPGLTFYRHMGTDRSKDFNEWIDYDFIITSYATLRNDVEIFNQFQFDYIVLDESQNIKNRTSQVSMAVKILKGNHRLALSGTPIENNSMELWSLFDFLMPGFLGSHQWFKKEWTIPVEKHNDDEKTGILKKMVYPFILRRKKEDVEKELPEKTEIVQSLRMEGDQLKLYVMIAKQYSKLVEKEIEEKGLSNSAFKILEGMLRLRQVCLFPHLVDPKYENFKSVKFDFFINMMDDILGEGHKVLVFSQFVKVLSVIREHFDGKKLKYSYIDGSIDVKTRGKMVEAFQEREDTRVFLLSLKAGGVAINLTAADYVIIFDPWWNPAVEAQAIDRSHRIGQTKKVLVYRMVVKDTIEEKMILLQEQKKELVDKLIASDGGAFKNLTKEDVLSLFRYS